MSKYKLIKEYPGSPKLGTTLTPKVEKEDENTNNFYWEGSWFNPKNYTEFWEKVEEVDYKILSFIRIDSTCVPKDNIGILFELQEDGLFATYNKYSFHSEKSMLEGKHSVKTGFFAIHSVKRLSDGEVFTVGDKITVDSEEKSYEIIKFSKLTDCMQVFGKRTGREIYYHLNSISKPQVKTPLFTTEDGVDIFKGDQFFVVDTQFDRYRIHETIGGHFSKDKPTYRRFKYGEEAGEYVLLNKPCLSLNDICNLPNNNTLMMSHITKEIKEIVKQKL